MVKRMSKLDAVQCEKNKLRGIKRAADHNGRAYTLLCTTYIEHFPNGGKPFKSEEARVYAEDHGLPEPPSGNKWGWGQVAKDAVKYGIIRRVGTAPTDNPKSHRVPVALYLKINDPDVLISNSYM